MKRIGIIIALIICQACGDNFLDLQPESVADIQDVYQTEDDFFQAIIGAYDELQSSGQYGRNFQFLFDTRADIVGELSAAFQDGIYYEIDRFLLRPANPLLQQSWSSLYSGIYRCNIVLDKLNEVNLSANVAAQFAAEARFIRAISYFNIVRIWGDAPLIINTITPDEALQVVRDDKQIIYTFIVNELEEIRNQLPGSYAPDAAGRVTSWAATGLLGKVYLELELYVEAENVLSEIISANSFALVQDFDQVFDLQNEMNEEILFAIRWKRLLEETNLFYSRSNQPIEVDQSFIDSFEDSDVRGIYAQIGNVGSYFVPNKYLDPAGADGKTGMDYPVLRYADVLLMYAEAINAQRFEPNGEAFRVVNEVRNRSGLSSLTNIQDQGEFRSALLIERRRELIFEGHAWFDLIRLGNPIDIFESKGINITEGQYVFPVPQSEIDRINNSGFEQNEAYN
ncbi:MAG: RagB/SusD family nutrient uptake outer membrane protein [Cyclobacteriaceae bacterium]